MFATKEKNVLKQKTITIPIYRSSQATEIYSGNSFNEERQLVQTKGVKLKLPKLKVSNNYSTVNQSKLKIKQISPKQQLSKQAVFSVFNKSVETGTKQKSSPKSSRTKPGASRTKYTIYNVPTTGFGVKDVETSFQTFQKQIQKFDQQIAEADRLIHSTQSSFVQDLYSYLKREAQDSKDRFTKQISIAKSQLLPFITDLETKEASLKESQSKIFDYRFEDDKEISNSLTKQISDISQQISIIKDENEIRLPDLVSKQNELIQILNDQNEITRRKLTSFSLLQTDIKKQFEEVEIARNQIERKTKNFPTDLFDKLKENNRSAREESLSKLRVIKNEYDKNGATDQEKTYIDNLIEFMDNVRYNEDYVLSDTISFLEDRFARERSELEKRLKDAQELAKQTNKKSLEVLQDLKNAKDEISKLNATIANNEIEIEEAKKKAAGRDVEVSKLKLDLEQTTIKLSDAVQELQEKQKSTGPLTDKSEKLQKSVDAQNLVIKSYQDVLQLFGKGSVDGSIPDFENIAKKLRGDPNPEIKSIGLSLDGIIKDLRRNPDDANKKTSDLRKELQTITSARDVLQTDLQNTNKLLNDTKNAEVVLQTVISSSEEQRKKIQDSLGNLQVDKLEKLQKENDELKKIKTSYESLSKGLAALNPNSTTVDVFSNLEAIRQQLEDKNDEIISITEEFAVIVASFSKRMNENGYNLSIGSDGFSTDDITSFMNYITNQFVDQVVKTEELHEEAIERAKKEQKEVIELKKLLDTAGERREELEKQSDAYRSTINDQSDTISELTRRNQELRDNYTRFATVSGTERVALLKDLVSYKASEEKLRDTEKKLRIALEKNNSLSTEIRDKTTQLQTAIDQLEEYKNSKKLSEPAKQTFKERIKQTFGIDIDFVKDDEIITVGNSKLDSVRQKSVVDSFSRLIQKGFSHDAVGYTRLKQALDRKDLSIAKPEVESFKKILLDSFNEITIQEDNNKEAYNGYNWKKGLSSVDSSRINRALLYQRLKIVDGILNADAKTLKTYFDNLNNAQSLYRKYGNDPSDATLKDAFETSVKRLFPGFNAFGEVMEGKEKTDKSFEKRINDEFIPNIRKVNNGRSYTGVKSSALIMTDYINFKIGNKY
jgi:DNA repair exonuclease SbcCD ATPase subunit